MKKISPEQKDDILLVDKPKGITSFDVIRQLRRILKIKKMGHSGTLDPFATGLLIVGIGKGTQKLSEYIGLSKTYIADIVLGIATDTGDSTGNVLIEKDASGVTKSDVEIKLSQMVGTLMLPVPVYSAVKRQGEALYKKARRGESVELPIKPMTIHKILLLDFNRDRKKIVCVVEMYVGSGAYVRSIAEELGRRLGLPAMVQELRRISIGDFQIKDARTL